MSVHLLHNKGKRIPLLLRILHFLQVFVQRRRRFLLSHGVKVGEAVQRCQGSNEVPLIARLDRVQYLPPRGGHEEVELIRLDDVADELTDLRYSVAAMRRS